jgi:hypothetical protein
MKKLTIYDHHWIFLLKLKHLNDKMILLKIGIIQKILWISNIKKTLEMGNFINNKLNKLKNGKNFNQT